MSIYLSSNFVKDQTGDCLAAFNAIEMLSKPVESFLEEGCELANEEKEATA
jgi:hypothetical protein